MLKDPSGSDGRIYDHALELERRVWQLAWSAIRSVPSGPVQVISL